jgi:hypothetical protein
MHLEGFPLSCEKSFDLAQPNHEIFKYGFPRLSPVAVKNIVGTLLSGVALGRALLRVYHDLDQVLLDLEGSPQRQIPPRSVWRCNYEGLVGFRDNCNRAEFA